MKKILLFALMALAISCGKNDDQWGQKPDPEPDPTPNLTEIILSRDELLFDTAVGARSITVYLSYENGCDYNARWEVTGGTSWCTSSVTNGKDRDEVTFTVEKHIAADNRTATFNFSCGDVTAELVITQKGFTPIDIHIGAVGTLDNLLSDYDKTTISALKITGVMNDEDILTIRTLPNLAYLDLSEVPLIALPANCFKSMEFKKVLLPTTLQSIPKGLFYNCQLLESTAIPSEVTKIGGGAYEGSGAFCNCTALTSINIPANVEVIESYTFRGCKSLAVVTFDKGSKLRGIGGGSIGIPSTISPPEGGAIIDASYGAFSDCTSLMAIEIPANVETIENAVFYRCISLTSVTFEEGSRLKNIIGGFYRWDDGGFRSYGAFEDCRSLTSIKLPASLETIGASAFWGCYALAKVDALACVNLKSIGTAGNRYAHTSSIFSSVSLVVIGATIPPICEGAAAFGIGTADYSVLKVPSGSVNAYKQADGWRYFTSITGLDE